MRKIALLAIAWCLSVTGQANASAEANDVVAAIVGLNNPEPLTRDELRAIFLEKRRFWSSGERIQAVNLPPSNPIRRTFSLRVLGASPEDLEDYWRELYFHGERPPYVFASEEAVLRFVAQTPGAIGYVSACAVDKRVHVVWQSEPVTCLH